MKTTQDRIIALLFDAYSEGDSVVNTPLDKKRSDLYHALFSKMEQAGMDTEELVDLYDAALEAAFYAGAKVIMEIGGKA